MTDEVGATDGEANIANDNDTDIIVPEVREPGVIEVPVAHTIPDNNRCNNIVQLHDEAVDDYDDETADIEIAGLHSPTNGRSCTIHEVCGRNVKPGDLLRLVRTVVCVRGNNVDALKCVRVMDGVDGCTVAFVPKHFLKMQLVQDNINKFVYVKEMYRLSHNLYKREKSSMNFGMASCIFLENIEQDE
jgi:hypothetical protein